MTADLILVDFDDTLVETAPRFRRARQALFARLVAYGFDEALAHRVHHDEVDPAMLERYGLGPGRLEPSFRETYLRLCALERREADPVAADACAALADGVAGTPPPLDGALEALARLADARPTALYTQSSEPDYQLRCVREAGVLDVLPPERVRICERKTTAEFRATLAHFGTTDPEHVWMVGNSVRSDINPALSVGARAILVEAVEPWIGDIATPVSDDFVRRSDFPSAVEYLTTIPAHEPAI